MDFVAPHVERWNLGGDEHFLAQGKVHGFAAIDLVGGNDMPFAEVQGQVVIGDLFAVNADAMEGGESGVAQAILYRELYAVLGILQAGVCIQALEQH